MSTSRKNEILDYIFYSGHPWVQKSDVEDIEPIAESLAEK